MTEEISDFLGKYTKSGDPVCGVHRFKGLMKKLGDPQDTLRFIHVAGTNGKGSVTRMTANALTLAGYRTGEFTSPFVRRYNDRIKINGSEIPDEELSRLIGIIRTVLDGDTTGYSQFEITNAVAFLWFAEQKCDVIALETGLGGLYDSTNIIGSNICSVITSVSYDHTAVLGDTIEKIACQKAGIIKENRPVVIYPKNPPEAVKVITDYAGKLHSPVIIPGMNELNGICADINGCKFVYNGHDYRTAMTGIHQVYNSITAIEALNIAVEYFPKLNDNIIARGIEGAVLPSRCQILQKSGPMIIVDGAHNPDGMAALAALIKDIPLSPKIMICGMAADKDSKAAAAYISPYIDTALCVEGFAPKTTPADVLAGYFGSSEIISLEKALERAKILAGDNGLVVIGGSLYLHGALIVENAQKNNE